MASEVFHKIYGRVIRLAEQNIALGEVLRGVKNACLAVRYRAGTLFCRTDEKIVAFCSFEGRSYSDSPRALFEYMVRCGAFTEYTFVWGFRGDPEKYRKMLARRVRELTAGAGGRAGSAGGCRKVPRICIVRYDSADWRRCMACAGYWILNYKVKDYLAPRKGQIFVQTWHGTPLKRLGYDLTHFDNPLSTAEGTARHYAIEIRKITYFLSPSSFATEKFRSAWRMADFGKADVILEEGYPRNDILSQYTPQMVRRIRRRIFGTDGVPRRGDDGHRKKVILYAPTYRQEQHESGRGYTYEMPLDLRQFKRDLGDDFVLLYRAHYLIADQIDFDAYRGFVYDVSDVDDINDLYLISDLMITDYSSSMFDFSVLKRPMIFYMYDLEYYRDRSNGFYFDPEEVLPGPIVRTQEALTAAVRETAASFSVDEKYRQFLETFDPYEDGHVCDRVIREIFKISV